MRSANASVWLDGEYGVLLSLVTVTENERQLPQLRQQR